MGTTALRSFSSRRLRPKVCALWRRDDRVLEVVDLLVEVAEHRK
jgi:hypothetical protein